MTDPQPHRPVYIPPSYRGNALSPDLCPDGSQAARPAPDRNIAPPPRETPVPPTGDAEKPILLLLLLLFLSDSGTERDPLLLALLLLLLTG